MDVMYTWIDGWIYTDVRPLRLECHFSSLKSGSLILFSRSPWSRFIEKRPVRLRLEIQIASVHS